MKLVLTPYESLGPIRFGMSREEVRAVLAVAVHPFKKTPDATTLTDAFEAEGIYVSYDDQGDCEAVEVASPAEPVLDGETLLGQPFSQLRDRLKARGDELEVDASGLTDLTSGLGLYAPSAEKAPNDPIEAVIAFRRGYYD